MDKSRWVPVFILGILTAGAAFVLLEPSQPIQRPQDICSDLKSEVIIPSSIYWQTAYIIVNQTLKVSGEALTAFDIQRWGTAPGI